MLHFRLAVAIGLIVCTQQGFGQTKKQKMKLKSEAATESIEHSGAEPKYFDEAGNRGRSEPGTNGKKRKKKRTKDSTLTESENDLDESKRSGSKDGKNKKLDIFGIGLDGGLSYESITVSPEKENNNNESKNSAFKGFGVKGLFGLGLFPHPNVFLYSGLGLQYRSISISDTVESKVGTKTQTIEYTATLSPITLRLELAPALILADTFGIGPILAFDHLLSGSYQLTLRSSENSDSDSGGLQTFSNLSYGARLLLKIIPTAFVHGFFTLGNGSFKIQPARDEANSDTEPAKFNSMAGGLGFTFVF